MEELTATLSEQFYAQFKRRFFFQVSLQGLKLCYDSASIYLFLKSSMKTPEHSVKYVQS